MKKRIWILILTAGIIVIMMAGLIAIRHYGYDTRFREKINEIVSESLGGEFESSSVYILPWSFGVKDARFRLSGIPVEFAVEKISIEYNIFKVITNKFQFASGARNIFLDSPHLTYLIEEDPADTMKTEQLKSSELDLTRLPGIRVVILDAAVSVSKGDSSLVLAKGIDGWLDARSPHKIIMHADGAVLNKSDNTTWEAQLTRDLSSYTLTLDSEGCTLTDSNLSLLTGDIRPEGGIFDLVYERKKEGSAVTQNGSFTLNEAAFSLDGTNIKVDDISASGRILTDELIFDKSTALLWGSRPELSGSLIYDPQPFLSLSVNADSIDVETVLTELYPRNKRNPSGSLRLEAEVKGPLDDLTLSLDASSDSLHYMEASLGKSELQATLNQGNVRLNKLTSHFKSYELRASGRSTSVVDLQTEKKFDLDFTAYRLKDKSRLLNLAINGRANIADESYAARFTTSFPFADGSVPSVRKVSGSLSLRGDELMVDAKNDYIKLGGKVMNVYDQDVSVQSKLTLTSFPILNFCGLADTSFVIQGESEISGGTETLTLKNDLRLSWGNRMNSHFSGAVIAENLLEDSISIGLEGALDDHRLFKSKAMNWSLNFRSDREKSYAQIHDPQGLRMSVAIDHASGAINGEAMLDQLPLEWIIDIARYSEFGETGKITGKAIIDGTITEPRFHTPDYIQATELKVGGLDRLVGTGLVHGGLSELVFEDFNVSRKGIHILHSDSGWRKGERYVLHAVGDNVQLAAIDDIISDTRKTDGIANYDLTIAFSRWQADIDGDFTVRDGHFYDIPFTSLSATLDGGSDGFIVRDCRIEREGVYHGRGSAESGFFWENSKEDSGLKMDLVFEGDLLKVLPALTGSIKSAKGQSQLMITMGGTWVDPMVMDAELFVSGASIEPAFLVDSIDNINATLTVDETARMENGFLPVTVVNATGDILGKKLSVRNVDPGKVTVANPDYEGLLSIINEQANLDFGVLNCQIISENQRDSAVEFHVPGFMKEKETGRFSIGDNNGFGVIVGASTDGDHLTAYIGGELNVLSGDVHFPLIQAPDEDDDDSDVSFLDDIYWNIKLNGGQNVNYVHEQNMQLRLGGTTVSKTMVKLDENTEFNVKGRLSDDSFRVTGKARSFSGSIYYYGAEFTLERAELTLDSSNSFQPATLAAKAQAIVYDDATNSDTEIYLNIYFVDKDTGSRREASGYQGQIRDSFRTADTSSTIDAGPLGKLMIEFSSSNPTDDTLEKILARLGISADNILGAATGAFAAGIENYYFDPLMRPLEDAVRRYTHLDVVQLTPSMLGNFMRSQIGSINRFGTDSEYFLFDRSRIMVGEYFFNDWFLSYRGQYGLGRDYLRRRERGFYHEFGLQYILKHNTRFQLNYNYDEIINKADRRFEIRYDFEF